MNKKLSKELLQRQIDKLGKPSYQTNDVWLYKTASLIKDFFGDGSEEYKYIKSYQFKRELITIGDVGNITVTNTKYVIQFLEGCIETIDHKGLYRIPKTNFLTILDNTSLIGILIFVSGVIGTTCYSWGKYSSDVQNIELRQQVNAQQATIDKLQKQIKAKQAKLPPPK